MGSPSELTLDYKPNGYRSIQKPSTFGDQPDQTQKLQEFLSRLEEERLKIEAFKRELPLCMQLLNNAMEAYKQQLESYQASQGGVRPVLEEFIPIKNMSLESTEKSNWMVSAQLWSSTSEAAKQEPIGPIKEINDQSFNVSPKLALDTKQRSGGGFLPFSKDKNKVSGSASRALPELALVSSPEKEMEEKNCIELESGGERRSDKCNKGDQQGKGSQGEGQSPASQTHRKARRCWSPDLHRRFVNALQILGGSQVATPKQIRELMKVDGLTNDEVKSHLQKYRLHTRRPIPGPQASAAAPPQLVVLGGIWVPSEYAASAAAGQAIYGAHPAPPHFCSPGVPQEFYSTPPVPHHHHHHHHHLHPPHRTAYKARTTSPESDVRSGGERSESIEEGTEERDEEEEVGEETEEDEENGKALVALELNVEEESNGSNVALKF